MNESTLMPGAEVRALNDLIQEKSRFIDDITTEIGKTIVGQSYMVERLLLGLLSGGHILLEGVPGLAKTLAIKSLAATIDAKFSRIQFTPDLLPADVVGTMIYNQRSNEFTVKKGPVFANFVLADEINRSPAKVQSALLEAMQEKQVTIGESTFRLEEPFLVLATQNPIEQEGTYPLPEAQIDRFMLKCVISYPNMDDERQIMRQNVNQTPAVLQKVASLDQVMEARQAVRKIYMDEKIEQYILQLVFATRNPAEAGLPSLRNVISFGASPRASINLAFAAKAYAFVRRRGFVIPDDVRAVCKDVMRHRIGLTYEAEAENISSDDIVQQIMETVQVP